jgi:phosphohistidine swiveling domain-containing protein
MVKSFGSKADNLELLSDAGFNVPKFYVVPSQIAKDFSSNEGKARLKAELENWMKENNVSSIAVRSSSTQEDTKEQSFAGQFETVLDVGSGEDFIKALKTVFSSRQSSAYSKTTGLVHAIVQAFIEPDVSGVIFSVNPANGNNEFVINAARGRGTNVVEGKSAEQYFVDRLDTSRFSIRGESKFLMSAQIAEISKITLEVETMFGEPQDIEWAIKDDQLFVLQARPITKISHLRVWDSSNISESFPGIVLPLTFSIAKRGYLLGYKAQAYSAGLSWYELEAHNRTFDAMIGIFNGKMYYNLLNWYRYIALFPGSKRNQKFLDDQIATQGQAVYQAPRKLKTSFKIKFVLRVLYRTVFFKHELNNFYKRFAAFEEEMRRMPKSNDSQLLMLQYSHMEQTIIPQFARTLDNDFLVMTYHGWLKKLLNKWLPDKPFEKNSIIGSISGVMSAEQALSLYSIAEDIKKDEKAYLLLQKNSYELLDKHLADTEVQRKIEEYISVFGHRFAQDQKIEAPNPTLEKFGIYKVMKPYVRLDLSEVNKRLNDSSTVSNEIENTLLTRLSFTQKIIYQWLLKHLKRHLRLREKNRLLRGRVYGHMRELFPKIGEALVTEGLIDSEKDIFYLQVEEIYQAMHGTVIVNDLKERIKARKNAYDKFRHIDMPERFITTSLPSLEKVEYVKEISASSKGSIEGLISSPGTVEGTVLVLDEPVIPDEPYDILVARHTDPGWTPLIALAKGVIVEHGGMLSHAAIVTRELGIPSIIGVKDVTSILKTGMRVRINSQSSCVEILKS